ncbi:MAG: DEAD/DEAH box helicase [Gammaproteobacteria bacterium]
MTDEQKIPFTDLELPDELLTGVRTAGFEFCTPIQAMTLPRALAGHDVAGQAQTGTGKTAAFLLATMNQLLTNPTERGGKKSSPAALMIAPTRELAIQIHADAIVLGEATGFDMQVVFGGADYDKQRNALAAGVDILIGTPGRLIDYYKQGVYDLKHIQVIVLDEADRMFDLGFIKDIRYILRRLPPPEKRLNLMFSATLNQRVLELAYEHMNEPETVLIEPDKVTADRVTQSVYYPSNEEKAPLLVGLLRSMHAVRTMVFVNTKREADYLSHLMQHNGVKAQAISGDVPQNKRIRMLRDFQSGELPVLIATDVASRGLHVPDVSHVINYDLPQDPEDYVHRIGRTARAGASGDAISFACETYAFTLPEIEKFIGHRIPMGTIDHADIPTIEKPPPRPRRSAGSRRGGGGKSAPPRRTGTGSANKPAAGGKKKRRRRSRKRKDGGPRQDPQGD